MSSPLISTIIPCYNQGQFLHRALASVKAQNYPQVEIIVINDGSSEQKTKTIIKDLTQQKNPQLKIFTIKNRGSAGARNYGLDKATGDFIQFLDCDDELLPQKFSRQLQHFAKNPHLDISYTKYYLSSNNQKRYPPPNTLIMHKPFEDLLFRWEMSLSIPPHCFLFKRHCFQSHRFTEKFFSCEDWVLWSHLALAGFNFAFCNFTGAIYYQHPQSKTKNRERMYLANVLITAHLRSLIQDNVTLLTKFDQAAITRLKYVFYQYFQAEIMGDNPDRQELATIKSSKFFQLWQTYNHVLQKLGLKKIAS